MRRTASLALLMILVSFPRPAGTARPDFNSRSEASPQAADITEDHKALRYFVGHWDVTTTMWPAPGSPPTRFQNTCTGELIMDGRFIRLTFQGERMGRPFEALQISGYDVNAGAYKTVVIDNTSTGIYVLTGQYDAAARAYIYEGAWPTPGGGAIPFRSLIRIAGPDEYTAETFVLLPEGGEFKAVEERSLRKK